jgi:hypothetical protein
MCSIEGSVLQCVPEPQSAPGWNQPCNGRCAPGFFCLRAEGDDVGLCHKLCEEDLDCGEGGICALEIDVSPPLKACAYVCDLTDACPNPDTKCTAAQEETGGRWYTFCDASGAAQVGESCRLWSDCAAGLSCASVNGDDRCVLWCHVATADCPSGTCLPMDPPLVVQGVEFGFCL